MQSRIPLLLRLLFCSHRKNINTNLGFLFLSFYFFYHYNIFSLIRFNIYFNNPQRSFFIFMCYVWFLIYIISLLTLISISNVESQFRRGFNFNFPPSAAMDIRIDCEGGNMVRSPLPDTMRNKTSICHCFPTKYL